MIAICVSTAVSMPVGSARAADWPQWRGPERDGRSPDRGLLQEWPEDGPPLIHGDYVFASSGYGTGSALIKISKSGDALAAEEVYFLEANVMQNHHGGLILHDGYVYTGTGHNKGLPLSVKLDTGMDPS